LNLFGHFEFSRKNFFTQFLTDKSTDVMPQTERKNSFSDQRYGRIKKLGSAILNFFSHFEFSGENFITQFLPNKSTDVMPQTERRNSFSDQRYGRIKKLGSAILNFSEILNFLVFPSFFTVCSQQINERNAANGTKKFVLRPKIWQNQETRFGHLEFIRPFLIF
jgi:hypothetical protein